MALSSSIGSCHRRHRHCISGSIQTYRFLSRPILPLLVLVLVLVLTQLLLPGGGGKTVEAFSSSSSSSLAGSYHRHHRQAQQERRIRRRGGENEGGRIFGIFVSSSSSDTRQAAVTSTETTMNDNPDYTEEELKAALESLLSDSENPDEDGGHIYGHGDPDHQLSMLQTITATRILDYERYMNDPSEKNHHPTQTEWEDHAKSFASEYGPILNLQDVIQGQSPRMALAAEFKRASPSKGDIAISLDCGDQSMKYAHAGADIISVLTERRWFQGSLDDLRQARIRTTTKAKTETEEGGGIKQQQQPRRQRPRPAILRKEFITHPYQIAEAAAHGADTILLIVAILPKHRLKDLIDYARTVHGPMEPLVEVHDPSELDVALSAGARVIGVNNRNLHTFQLDLRQTHDIARLMTDQGRAFLHRDDADGGSPSPPPFTLCALSGMSTSRDVDQYRRIGVGMCLIGESLMRAPDPRRAIADLCLDPADYINSKQQRQSTTTRTTAKATRDDGQDDDDATTATTTVTSAAGVHASSATTTSSSSSHVMIKVCGITNPEDALVACRAGANWIGVIFVPKSKRCVTAEQAQQVVRAVRAFGERRDRIDIPPLSSSTTTMGDEESPVKALASSARALEAAASQGRPLVVGVFQNQDPEFIQDMIDRCGLDMIQLHGREGMEAASRDRNGGIPAIRVVDIETDDPDENGGGGKTTEKNNDGGTTTTATPTSSPKAIETLLSSLTSDPAMILLDTSIRSRGGGGGTGVTFDWSIPARLRHEAGLPVIIAGGLTPDNVEEAIRIAKPWGMDVSSGVESEPGKKDHDKVRAFVKRARKAAATATTTEGTNRHKKQKE